MSTKQTKVTSSHWGAFNVTTEDDRIIGVAPFEADPTPCEILHAVPAAVHHRARVARPSFRRGCQLGLATGSGNATVNIGADPTRLKD